jgi:hypothetical protein
MADATVQVPTEGSGPLIDVEQFTIQSQTVRRQRVQALPYVAIVQASYTRPPDTTAYATGDSVSNSTTAPTALAFTAARFNGGAGVITAAHFIDDSNPGTKPTLELWLFAGAAAPTPTNDNAAIAWSDADVANLVGVIEFLSTEVRVGGSPGNSVCTGRLGTLHNFRLPFRCGASVQTIWGMVVVRTAYTPANAGVLRFNLHIEQE